MCTFNILVSDFQGIFLANFQNTWEVTSHFCLRPAPQKIQVVRRRPNRWCEGAGKTQCPNQKKPANTNTKQQKHKQVFKCKTARSSKDGKPRCMITGEKRLNEWGIIAKNNAWNGVWRGLQLFRLCTQTGIFCHMKSLRSLASPCTASDNTGCSLHGPGTPPPGPYSS